MDTQSKNTSNFLKSNITMVVRLLVSLVLFVFAFVLSRLWVDNFLWILIGYISSYLLVAYDVILKAVKNISKGKIFDEHFLMSVASIGAFVLREFPEAVAVMWLYQLGEMLQDVVVDKSRDSIRSLMDVRADFARKIIDGQAIKVDPREVAVGDVIEILPGEKVPIDGEVVSGKSSIDNSALTGESVPIEVSGGDEVLSGSINISGVIRVNVTKIFGESTASKILDLIEDAQAKKSSTERFITKFSKIYTPIVCGLAVIVAVVPSLFTGFWDVWIERALMFLIISCPCAIVISVPLTYFGGLGAASRAGILMKGSNYLEVLCNLGAIALDKTGTITKGKFSVSKIKCAKNSNEEEVLKFAAYGEWFSNHPIAKSIKEHFGKDVNQASISNYREVAGHGILCEVDGQKVIVGTQKHLIDHGVKPMKVDEYGTKVYVAKNNKCIGVILISDTIKESSNTAIAEIKRLGIKKTVMLTGDNEMTAKYVANQVGVDDYKSSLLPMDKVTNVEYLISELEDGRYVAFVGDGVNDAPVLSRADVGIAMGALGSDAAIEAADVVLMGDDLQQLVHAIKLSIRTHKIAWQNIVFALFVKVAFMLLGIFGIASMTLAVFADVGVTLLAVANALRILRK